MVAAVPVIKALIVVQSKQWRLGLRLFEDGRPNKKKNKNNKMSSDMGSVPDPET